MMRLKEFIKGAVFETIITDFSDNDNKIVASKPLLNGKNDQFNRHLKIEMTEPFAEITFMV